MRVLRKLAEMTDYRDVIAPTTSVGFVPTMGGLHEGHLSLVRESAIQNRLTIVSLFVNPAQFAPNEDLSTYPRTEAQDLQMCASAGADIVFCPSTEDVYPPSFGTTVNTSVGAPDRNPRSEGASRPTFFQGVATVLVKLFALIRPHRAYFGQKDAQQCAVVKQLVRDLWFGIQIVACPTVREEDGLAMSSRNAYLSGKERERAPLLYRALCAGKKAFEEGMHNVEELRVTVRGILEGSEKDVAHVRFEVVYVSICSAVTMEELEGELEDGKNVLLCAAAMLGKARLIDNVKLGPID